MSASLSKCIPNVNESPYSGNSSGDNRRRRRRKPIMPRASAHGRSHDSVHGCGISASRGNSGPLSIAWNVLPTWHEARGCPHSLKERHPGPQHMVGHTYPPAEVIWTTVPGVLRFENAGVESVCWIEMSGPGAASQRSVSIRARSGTHGA